MVKTKGVHVPTLDKGKGNVEPVAATNMVTRAKSSVKKRKLASKTNDTEIVRERKELGKEAKGKKFKSKEERDVTTVSIAPPKEELIGVFVSGQKNEKRNKKKKVQYEVDCSDVEKVDIFDFQNYIQDNLKVANRKKNKCLKVKVVRGTTVIVKSSVYMAKKSVRSLIIQYLHHKKIVKVHVRCEAPTAYKLISDC